MYIFTGRPAFRSALREILEPKKEYSATLDVSTCAISGSAVFRSAKWESLELEKHSATPDVFACAIFRQRSDRISNDGKTVVTTYPPNPAPDEVDAVNPLANKTVSVCHLMSACVRVAYLSNSAPHQGDAVKHVAHRVSSVCHLKSACAHVAYLSMLSYIKEILLKSYATFLLLCHVEEILLKAYATFFLLCHKKVILPKASATFLMLCLMKRGDAVDHVARSKASVCKWKHVSRACGWCARAFSMRSSRYTVVLQHKHDGSGQLIFSANIGDYPRLFYRK